MKANLSPAEEIGVTRIKAGVIRSDFSAVAAAEALAVGAGLLADGASEEVPRAGLAACSDARNVDSSAGKRREKLQNLPKTAKSTKMRPKTVPSPGRGRHLAQREERSATSNGVVI
eukprot:m.37129 g.37129  ORF g.37129 m.37129 type:complete len:116 (+) comp32328_c0_seq7:1385-1732(+)